MALFEYTYQNCIDDLKKDRLHAAEELVRAHSEIINAKNTLEYLRESLSTNSLRCGKQLLCQQEIQTKNIIEKATQDKEQALQKIRKIDFILANLKEP